MKANNVNQPLYRFFSTEEKVQTYSDNTNSNAPLQASDQIRAVLLWESLSKAHFLHL